jgi:hypothetical protein
MSRRTPDPFQEEQASVRVVSVPLLGGVRGGFMFSMLGQKNRLKDSSASSVQPTTDHRYDNVGLEAKETRWWTQPTTK